MSSKKIEFISAEEIADEIIDKPAPSKKFIPDWYKSANKFIEGEVQKNGLFGYNPTSATNTTYKSCSPFMDSFLTGYMWAAPADIEIKKAPEGYVIARWKTEGDFVSDHTQPQHPGLPERDAGYYNNQVLKWEFPFTIKTPPGYSTLFTHPLNRSDLPFRTLSAVVDTDCYQLPVKFPFQMLDFEGDAIIIKKGTPLCQFIPIKRESWVSVFTKFVADRIRKISFDYHSKIVNSYKSRFWNKKDYQ